MGAPHAPSSPSSESWVLFLYDHQMWVSLQFGDVVGCWGSSLALPSTRVRQDEREVEVAPCLDPLSPQALPLSSSVSVTQRDMLFTLFPHKAFWSIFFFLSTWCLLTHQNFKTNLSFLQKLCGVLPSRHQEQGLCIMHLSRSFFFQEGTWVVWQEKEHGSSIRAEAGKLCLIRKYT